MFVKCSWNFVMMPAGVGMGCVPEMDNRATSTDLSMLHFPQKSDGPTLPTY